MAEGTEAKPAPASGGLWKRLSEAAGTYAAIAGALGLLVFVLLALASSAIYSPLGVDASDVGLSRAELLAQSAVLLLVVLVLAGAFGLAMVLLIRGAQRAGTGLTTAWAVTVMALFIIGDNGVPVAETIGTAVLVLIPVALETAHLLGARLPDRWAAPALSRRTTRWATGAGVAAAAAMVLLFGVAQTTTTRDALRRAERAPGVLEGDFRLASPWDAQIAEVTWPGEKRPEELAQTTCLLYLGQANGTSIFVRPPPRGEDPTVLRVAATSITMTLHPSRERCPAA